MEALKEITNYYLFKNVNSRMLNPGQGTRESQINYTVKCKLLSE